MHSFRLKLGILLAIIAFAFIVSQIVYRNTIKTLHASVSSSVATVEIVHNAEDFHSSIHMMLFLASRYAERKDGKTYQEYETIGVSARNAIDALIKCAGQSMDKHRGEDTPMRTIGDLRSLFYAFAVETDKIFSSVDKENHAHLKKARNLFDDILRNHLIVIHDYHEARLLSLKTEANEMNQRINFLFYGQLVVIFLAAVVALAFSDRVLVNLYTMMERHALSDGLTGLKNRRYLDDILLTEARGLILRAAPFSIILADIDHFKLFNDTYGHQAGDKLLMEFADHLRKEVRKADTVVRYGGEEFFVILPGAGKAAAFAVAEKIRKQIESAEVVLPSGDSGKKITASFGIASFPDDGIGKFTSLLKKADERLYDAKASGRNRVVC